jgi:hypothetical protein
LRWHRKLVAERRLFARSPHTAFHTRPTSAFKIVDEFHTLAVNFLKDLSANIDALS